MSDPKASASASVTHNPYRFLPYSALIVGASSRFSHALAISVALLTVFALSSLILVAASPLLPQLGRRFVPVFIASLVASSFQALFSLYSPILALELAFFVGLVPVAFVASTAMGGAASPGSAVLASQREALPVAALLAIFSLVREVFGYGCITLPLRSGALVVIGSDASSGLAARVLVSAAGGFMFFGYVMAALRRSRSRFPDYPAQGRDA